MSEFTTLQSIIYNAWEDSGRPSQELLDFSRMMHMYGAALSMTQAKLSILDREFQSRFDHNPIHHMEHRLKTPRSLMDKLKRKGLAVTMESIRHHITDIAGIRVICNYISDIYRIANMLVAQSDIELIRVRDYIKSPKENGYRSLHLVINVPVMLSTGTQSLPVEVQVRTIAMDMWASMEHEIRYKGNAEISPEVAQTLKSCAERIDSLDADLQSAYFASTGYAPYDEDWWITP